MSLDKSNVRNETSDRTEAMTEEIGMTLTTEILAMIIIRVKSNRIVLTTGEMMISKEIVTHRPPTMSVAQDGSTTDISRAKIADHNSRTGTTVKQTSRIITMKAINTLAGMVVVVQVDFKVVSKMVGVVRIIVMVIEI